MFETSLMLLGGAAALIVLGIIRAAFAARFRELSPTGRGRIASVLVLGGCVLGIGGIRLLLSDGGSATLLVGSFLMIIGSAAMTVGILYTPNTTDMPPS